MVKLDFIKPKGKLKIDKVFVNSKNGQMTVILPKKKMKSVPTKLEISYW
jgi:hypothetical protein